MGAITKIAQVSHLRNFFEKPSVLYRTVSNGFEKSARNITATSPFYIALSRSQRLPIGTMQVECPLRNPDIVSLRVVSSSQ